MTQILRQSTQVVVRIGPAAAVADGFTPVTTLDLSTADEAELLKAAGAATSSIAAATFAAITGADGWYDLTLTTTHTDTLGTLDVVVNDDSLILPIFRTFQVIEEAAFDAIYAASAAPATAAALATVDSNVDAILLDTAEIGAAGAGLTEAGGTGDHLTAINLPNQTMDIVGNITGNLSGSVGSVTARVTANTDQISGDSVAADNLETAFDDAAGAVPWLGILDQGTAQSSSATELVLRAATPFAANDVPIGCTVMVLGSTQGYWQVGIITDYVTATDTATVTFPVTPSGTITYKVLASAPAPATTDFSTTQKASINTEVDAAIETYHLDHLLATTYDPASKPGAADALLNELIESDAGVSRYTANALEQAPTGGSAPTAAEIADAVLDEALSGHVTAGTLGKAVADIETDATAILADTDVIGAAGAGLTEAGGTGDHLTALATAANLATVDTVVDAILVDTGTTLQAELDGIQADTEDIQARIPAALVSGRIDASVGAAAANTLTASALATDAVTEIVTAILTTAMTESYNADGSAPTVAQALHAIMQRVTEFSISDTTITVKKLDGSTTAMTLTLDSATSPTSSTRAT